MESENMIKLYEKFKDLNISVVLPAGGTGERVGIKPFKQFYLIEGKPLMCFSIETFESDKCLVNRIENVIDSIEKELSIQWIKSIVLVVAADQMDQANLICQNYKKVKIVAGSYSRHRSIAAGISYLEKDYPDLVIIHDAVRPLVPFDVLDRVVIAAYQYKAAGPTLPLTSTVISRDESGFLQSCLDRSKYFASEMPQAFSYSTILEAYNKCSDYDFDFGTECLHLVDKYCNVKAKLVDGTPNLWKVTYERDLYSAERILKQKANCYLHFGTLSKAASDAIESKLNSQIAVCNEIIGSTNCIIFHVNCVLSENLNCCIPEIYKLKLPNRIINVFCTDKMDLDYNSLFEFVDIYSKKFQSNNKICFMLWKRSKDWTEDILVSMTNLFIDLFAVSSQNFCNQLLII